MDFIYSAEEIQELLSQNGFTLIENKTLADLNSKYFAPDWKNDTRGSYFQA